jgi:4-amino-4-deoxy-L-arabinose transferase-like glycosyltransferase
MPEESTESRSARPAWLSQVQPREVGYGALIAVAALFIYLVYSSARAGDILDPAAMDYAQVARNIAQGEGFTTNIVRPMSLARVQNISHHPDLYHAPLHPLWTSLFFRLGGATPQMAAWACGAAYLLSLPLMFYLGLKLFGRRIALLALALYGVNYLSLQYAVSGLETSLATLLATVLMLGLYFHLTAGDKPAPVTAALCGAAASLCFLVDYIYLCLLLPVLVVLVLRSGKRRWAEAAICLAAFVLVAAPWAVRNTRVAGSPFFTLELGEIVSNTITYKGHSLFRQYTAPAEPLSFLVSHPREIWQKVRPMTLNMYESLPSLGGPWVAAFFLAGIFLRFGGGGLRNLRGVHYAWVLLLAATLCFMSADARYLVALSPLVAIVAAAAFLTLVDQWVEKITGPRHKRQALGWSIAALVAICWYPVFGTTATWEKQSPDAADELKLVAKTLADRKVHPVLTDQPWTLAWFGNIEAVWLPQTSGDLHVMETAVGPMRYMVLGPLIASAADQEGLAPWAELYAAARRGLKAPHERFVAADILGEKGQWVLFGRIPEGAAGGVGGEGGTGGAGGG